MSWRVECCHPKYWGRPRRLVAVCGDLLQRAEGSEAFGVARRFIEGTPEATLRLATETEGILLWAIPTATNLRRTRRSQSLRRICRVPFGWCSWGKTVARSVPDRSGSTVRLAQSKLQSSQCILPATKSDFRPSTPVAGYLTDGIGHIHWTLQEMSPPVRYHSEASLCLTGP